MNYGEKGKINFACSFRDKKGITKYFKFINGFLKFKINNLIKFPSRFISIFREGVYVAVK